MVKVNYIPVDKIHLHLKLKRSLAQFIGINTYFESLTFDWVELKQEGSHIRATLTRSFDEGDTIFSDILTFKTANEIDELENKYIVGSLETCLDWVDHNTSGNRHKFIKAEALKIIYEEMVRQGWLGQ
jgi:hypothetical protein